LKVGIVSDEELRMLKNLVSVLNIGSNVLHENARASIREAARRWGANYLEILLPVGDIPHPFYQKLRLADHVPDQCRVLLLDGDVLIRHDCPSPFEIVPHGQLGWVRTHHPSHAGATWSIFEPVRQFAAKFGMALDVKEEYAHTGVMLFEFPLHRELFAENQRIIDAVGFDPQWQISDQAIFSLARKKLGLPIFWLPAMFQMAGDVIWSGWTAEMKWPVIHFCGPIYRDAAIPRTVWDNLGPDRMIPGTSHVRWQAGKPRSLMNEPELPFFIREVAKVRFGKIVEIGTYLGGSAWWGANIARDNYSEYFCVDDWESAREFESNATIHKGFLLNMRDAGLDEYVKVVRNRSIEAARGFDDGSLDMVFIDGDHSFEACTADINAYWPKLKPHGVMLGHDYTQRNGYGVFDAVNKRFGKPDEVSDGEWPIWKVTKR
jgi:hypothetical protein